jgi:hypothetical protein
MDLELCFRLGLGEGGVELPALIGFSGGAEKGSGDVLSPRGFHALPPRRRHQVIMSLEATLRQGLTLVRFSAQLEPWLTHKTTLRTLNTPPIWATQPLRAPHIP